MEGWRKERMKDGIMEEDGIGGRSEWKMSGWRKGKDERMKEEER